jgi:hypothetical protein
MLHWWSRVSHNPLVAPVVARSRGFWRVAPAVVALLALLACGVTVAAWAAVAANATDTPPSSLQFVLVLFGAQLAALLSGLAWLAVLLILPAVAATTVSRARETGMWDLMRLTLLTAADIVDGFFVRTLARYPLWLLVIPAFPLGAASSTNVLFFGIGSGERLPADAVMSSAVLLAGAAALRVAVALLQAATCVMLGIAAGVAAGSRNGALGWVFGALVIFEWIVPGICGGLAGVILSGIALGAAAGTSSYAGVVYAGIAANIASGAVLLVYHAMMLIVVRDFARARAERGTKD